MNIVITTILSPAFASNLRERRVATLRSGTAVVFTLNAHKCVATVTHTHTYVYSHNTNTGANTNYKDKERTPQQVAEP